MDIRVRVHLAHFWKIWLFSSTSALATTSCCKTSEPCWQWCWQLLECQDFPKRAKNSLIFQKMCPMHANYDVQLWNQFLTINSDSTHQKWMKFAFIVTGSIFLQSYWVSDNVRKLVGGERNRYCLPQTSKWLFKKLFAKVI